MSTFLTITEANGIVKGINALNKTVEGASALGDLIAGHTLSQQQKDILGRNLPVGFSQDKIAVGNVSRLLSEHKPFDVVLTADGKTPILPEQMRTGAKSLASAGIDEPAIKIMREIDQELRRNPNTRLTDEQVRIRTKFENADLVTKLGPQAGQLNGPGRLLVGNEGMSYLKDADIIRAPRPVDEKPSVASRGLPSELSPAQRPVTPVQQPPAQGKTPATISWNSQELETAILAKTPNAADQAMVKDFFKSNPGQVERMRASFEKAGFISANGSLTALGQQRLSDPRAVVENIRKITALTPDQARTAPRDSPNMTDTGEFGLRARPHRSFEGVEGMMEFNDPGAVGGSAAEQAPARPAPTMEGSLRALVGGAKTDAVMEVVNAKAAGAEVPQSQMENAQRILREAAAMAKSIGADAAQPNVENAQKILGDYDSLLRGRTDAIADEMQQRFGNNIVRMNNDLTVPKGVPVASRGFASCIGTYIDNPESNTLAHYSLGSAYDIELLLNKQANAATNAVHFFVPGKMKPGPDGQMSPQPDDVYMSELRRATQRLDQLGVKYDVQTYKIIPASDARTGYEAGPYQDSIWVDEKGNFSAGGKIVPTPQPAAPAIAEQRIAPGPAVRPVSADLAAEASAPAPTPKANPSEPSNPTVKTEVSLPQPTLSRFRASNGPQSPADADDGQIVVGGMKLSLKLSSPHSDYVAGFSSLYSTVVQGKESMEDANKAIDALKKGDGAGALTNGTSSVLNGTSSALGITQLLAEHSDQIAEVTRKFKLGTVGEIVGVAADLNNAGKSFAEGKNTTEAMEKATASLQRAAISRATIAAGGLGATGFITLSENSLENGKTRDRLQEVINGIHVDTHDHGNLLATISALKSETVTDPATGKPTIDPSTNKPVPAYPALQNLVLDAHQQVDLNNPHNQQTIKAVLDTEYANLSAKMEATHDQFVMPVPVMGNVHIHALDGQHGSQDALSDSGRDPAALHEYANAAMQQKLVGVSIAELDQAIDASKYTEIPGRTPVQMHDDIARVRQSPGGERPETETVVATHESFRFKADKMTMDERKQPLPEDMLKAYAANPDHSLTWEVPLYKKGPDGKPELDSRGNPVVGKIMHYEIQSLSDSPNRKAGDVLNMTSKEQLQAFGSTWQAQRRIEAKEQVETMHADFVRAAKAFAANDPKVTQADLLAKYEQYHNQLKRLNDNAQQLGLNPKDIKTSLATAETEFNNAFTGKLLYRKEVAANGTTRSSNTENAGSGLVQNKIALDVVAPIHKTFNARASGPAPATPSPAPPPLENITMRAPGVST